MKTDKDKSNPTEDEIKYILNFVNLQKLNSAKEEVQGKILKYPKSPILLNILGAILFKQNKTNEAIYNYNHSIQLDPNYAQAHNNLGTAFHLIGKQQDAIKSFKKAIELKSNFAESYANLGNVLFEERNFEEALLYFKKTAEINPDFQMIFFNIGKTYMKLGQNKKALDSFEEALKKNSNLPEIYNNTGLALYELTRFSDSLSCFNKAIELNPTYEKAYNNLGNVLNQMGHYEDSNNAYKEAIKIKSDYFKAYSNLLFNLIYKIDFNAKLYLTEAKKFRENCKPIDNKKKLKYKYKKNPEKLRLGLVSADFGNHPGGHFTLSTLKSLSKKNFELISYSSNDRKDEIAIEFKPLFLKWNSIENKTDIEVIEQINNDGIHILIDMQGHSANNRLPLFINKPAPVQATWLGQGSTGIPEIDYFIGGPHITPKSEEKNYVEKIYRLPQISQCFTEPNFHIKVNELPALNNKFITFGCLNKISKINDEVILVWSNILKSVENSKLLLKTRELDDKKIVANIIFRFAKNKIKGDRLILKGKSKNREDSMRVYNEIDIGLDPFPFQGVTTTVEAAWMGVPVITLKGDRYLSHFGESINFNLNMNEWIAKNYKEYTSKANKFSRDLNHLSNIRKNLRQNAIKSPVFNDVDFANNFSDMLWKMWRKYTES
jgi:predicted O-linked N-acetylglucosamine transferase (SPINDLY family)